jgi:large subunit ribosomal protein L10
MPTERKIKQVEMLQDKLDRCSIAVATNPTGVDVNGMNEIRSKLRELNIEYKVVKNTLSYIAAEHANRDGLKDVVKGPTALAFGYGDPTEVAKALEEYIRVNRSPLSITGALMDDRALNMEQVYQLATLPSKPEIVSKMLGSLQSPISRLVGCLQNPMVGLVSTLDNTLRGLVTVINQRAQQLQDK